MSKIIEDVSKLTTIPDKSIYKLMDKFVYCISDAIVEDIISLNDITEADIGLGTLYIQHIGNEIKYKFIPNDYFNKVVIDSVTNKLNLLEKSVEKNLVDKITNTYKDLF